jgi:hypothetical protein
VTNVHERYTGYVPPVWLRPTVERLLEYHLEATIGAATRQGEAAAEDWRRRLSRIHFRQRYRRLVPLLKFLKPVLLMVRRAMKRSRSV